MRAIEVLSRHILMASFCLLIITCVGFAGNDAKEAAALFERAKQLSDIRAAGSPAFVLEGKFAILRDPDHPITGSYTEVWASPSLLRIEVSSGNFHSIKVTNDRKQWELNDDLGEKDIRSAANVIAYRMNGSWMDSRGAAKIIDRGNGSWILRCVDGHDDEYGGRQEFCFDKSGGQLVASSLPLIVKGGEAARRCAFTDFQKFGDKIFPRSINCMEGEKQVFEAKVTQLVLQKPDGSMFEMPPGAKEFPNCPTQLKAPEAVETPDPARIQDGPVVLSFVVGKDGKPGEAKVDISAGAEMDNAALDAVRHWRFKPATCEGQAMESRVSVIISSHVGTR